METGETWRQDRMEKTTNQPSMTIHEHPVSFEVGDGEKWSGLRESNPSSSVWKTVALPLS